MVSQGVASVSGSTNKNIRGILNKDLTTSNSNTRRSERGNEDMEKSFTT